jgi:hypothetical protein
LGGTFVSAISLYLYGVANFCAGIYADTFKLGGAFIDVNLKDGWGDSLLNIAAQADFRGCDPRKVDFVLRRGAKIDSRNHSGQSCLHLLVGWARNPRTANEAEFLILVIRGGADIHAVDNYGNSVSEIAYNLCYMPGYAGELWDYALSECGYDILQDTPAQIFERLWHGRETLCPYYDDPPLWPQQGLICNGCRKHATHVPSEPDVAEDDTLIPNISNSPPPSLPEISALGLLSPRHDYPSSDMPEVIWLEEIE